MAEPRFPCTKCRTPTPHISQVCEACRRIKCARCGRTFLRQKLQNMGRTLCGDCHQHFVTWQKRRDGYYDRSGEWRKEA